MSGQYCGHHEDPRKKLYRYLFGILIGCIILILFITLPIYLINRPTKPHYVLQDATVYAFNLSTPNLLTTTLQITLSSRNPNNRVGIIYDKVRVYATYHDQQITLPTLLPPSYQGHKDTAVWSPFVYGNAVPIAQYLATCIGQDQLEGTILLNVKVDGRIRWKVGTFVSAAYHLNVNCPAYINCGGKNNNGVAVSSTAIKYQLLMDCHVED